MLDKIQYGDYYRFLASLGVILIVLGLVLPYFYLQETFGIFIKQDEINAMPQLAQEIIASRQHIAKFAVEWLLWASGASIASGFILFSYALYKWRNRQIQEDAKLNAEIKKTDAETNKLNLESDQLKDATKISPAENIAIKTREIQELEVPVQEQRLSVTNYLLIESLIIEKFKIEYSDRYYVYSNYRINDREYDLILEPRVRQPLHEYYEDKIIIVEIKYIRHMSRRLIEQTLNHFASSVSSFPGRYKKGMIIFVLDELDSERAAGISDFISSQTEKTDLKLILIKVDDVSALKLKETISL